MQYDSEEVNRIARTISIADYIISEGEQPEKKSGCNWFFHCKNNSESHASCCVDVKRNYYTCYSCHNAGLGSGGNLVAYLINEEGMSYPQAAEKVLNLAGIDPKSNIVVQKSETLKYLKSLQKKEYEPAKKRAYTDYADYDKFSKQPSQTWINEGITAGTQRLYDIRTDPLRNRILYPLRDQDGKFITFKYRLDLPPEILKATGQPKYKIAGTVGRIDFLVGWQEAESSIKETGEVILLEGIKSVMKSREYDFPNAVACETSGVNKYQIAFLIKQHCKNVVIAFDKDKKFADIRKHLGMLTRFCNVSIINDKDNLLGEKDSPMDCGKETWVKLYNERIRVN